MKLDPLQRRHVVGLFRQLFDANASCVCMLDLQGEILGVNPAWTRFGSENGLPPDYQFEGTSYIDVCERAAQTGDEFARQALVGLLEVINTGRSKFSLTYPCHAPHERRWYKMWVEPQTPEVPVIVIAHLVERTQPEAGVMTGVALPSS